jgi:hypothetical protein
MTVGKKELSGKHVTERPFRATDANVLKLNIREGKGRVHILKHGFCNRVSEASFSADGVKPFH